MKKLFKVPTTTTKLLGLSSIPLLLLTSSKSLQYSTRSTCLQSSKSSTVEDKYLKRLSPHRRVGSIWRYIFRFSVYRSLLDPALEKLTLFGNDHTELVLDNQFETKYLPILIDRKYNGQNITQSVFSFLKSYFVCYPNIECFGYGVKNELSKNLYCHPESLQQVKDRKRELSQSLEFMENSKQEDFSNILLPLQMIPIRELDVWQWFSRSKDKCHNEYDIIFMNYSDKESLIENFNQLASYCDSVSREFNIPFEEFPMKLGYFNEFQKLFIENAMRDAQTKGEESGGGESDKKERLRLLWLQKKNLLASEKMGHIYFPKLRNNLFILPQTLLLLL